MIELRVLLVDDHPVVRAGLRAVVEGFEGIRVVAEADDGAAALKILNTQDAVGNPGGPGAPGNPETIDVVVMDVQMPGISGITATERIASTGGPPVLILTTFDTHADVVAALQAGAVGYLLKDAAPERLRQAIVDTAAGKPTWSDEVAAALMSRVQQPRTALSDREVEILTALATGASNRQLAGQMFISEATVKTHLVHIYEKLGVSNRTAAIAAAQQQRLI